MASLAGHLVRRTVEEFNGPVSWNFKMDEGKKIRIDGFSGFLLFFTILFFCYAFCAIAYTYGELVATLAAVEAPNTTAIVRTAPQEDSEESNAPLLSVEDKGQSKITSVVVDQEVLLIKQRPLTSSFCAIRRHLRAQGGRLARFRGLHIYLLNSILSSVVASAFSWPPVIRFNPILFIAVDVAVHTMFTRLSLFWNHVVISEPSQRSWRQRIPATSSMRKAMLPTAIEAAIQRVSGYLFLYTAIRLGGIPTYNRSSQPQPDQPLLRTLFPHIVTVMLGLFTLIAIQIPASIAIARVRASLLAEEEKPIVAFDRTFNNQVIPESAGGRGVLGLWTAWAGAERSTRLRVFGVYMKTLAMQIGLIMLGCLVFYAELRLILGTANGNKVMITLSEAFGRVAMRI